MAISDVERLKWDLTAIRNDLMQIVEAIEEKDLDYAPTEGMKSYRKQLIEVAGMEYETLTVVTQQRIPEWTECKEHINSRTKKELMATLTDLRRQLLEFLDSADEALLNREQALPDDWVPHYGDKVLPVIEWIRWLIRHEYYHLGQITSYRWIQGHNPYND